MKKNVTKYHNLVSMLILMRIHVCLFGALCTGNVIVKYCGHKVDKVENSLFLFMEQLLNTIAAGINRILAEESWKRRQRREGTNEVVTFSVTCQGVIRF